jgi:hypothetical protein
VLETNILQNNVSNFGFSSLLENPNGLIAGATISMPYHRVYDNLFRCMYGKMPVFTDDHIHGANPYIHDAIALLQASEFLEAAKHVRLPIEAHLLRLNQVLWTHIENNAEAWADVGIRLESPIIFRNAMAHIVGRYDLKTPKNRVDKGFIEDQATGHWILDLAERKAAELKNKKLLIERRLMEFYPSKMLHADNDIEASEQTATLPI